MVLILQIYRIFVKKGREESPVFLRKKEGQRTYQAWYKAFIIGTFDTDHDNEASPSFWRDHDRASWDLLFLWQDRDRGDRSNDGLCDIPPLSRDGQS